MTISFSPGDSIGESYRIVREIGQGGMGVVFQVTDDAGRDLALKCLAMYLNESSTR